jgi:GDP/UDP-N,N'-diacetylbacillosamine 2-epimerase (hydrolysing)
MRKICVISGTRADYGQLRWVMQGIKDESQLDLQIIVTGMHLSPEFGLTYKDIDADNFTIDRKLETLLSSDSSVGVAKSIGLGIISFADALADLKPDLILILGDRFEVFSAATAAMMLGIPIAHLHGGEITEGAIDDMIRHSISKMSYLHFVAADEYRLRLIQLGESPERIFLCGGLGVDVIDRTRLLSRSDLEDSLDLKFGSRNLLITFHPVTVEIDGGAGQLKELLLALQELQDTNLIFTMPNADARGRELVSMVEKFVATNSCARLFKSLGQQRYLSCIAQVDAVVGNSSSGISEAPSFKKPSINVGNRQSGRLKAASVIDCLPKQRDILKALHKLYTDEFQALIEEVKNPYGDVGASRIIVDTLKNIDLSGAPKKSFYNIPFSILE